MTKATPSAPSIRSLALWLIGAAAVALISLWLAQAIIGAVHRGELFPALLQNRDTKPVEYYYGVVNRLVLAGFLLLALIGSHLYVSRFASAFVALAVLVIGDVAFCVLSETFGGLLDVRLDGGIPELFQYYKEGSIAVLLLWTFRATGRQIFLGWACLFTFILVDDALKYHERAGAILGRLPGVDQLAVALHVRPVDIGEMLSLLPVLAALAAFLVVPYLRERPDGRSVVHRLGFLLGCLVMAGGVMDLVDRAALTTGSEHVQLLSLIEDGGEMLVMSLTLTYVQTVWKRFGRGRFAA